MPGLIGFFDILGYQSFLDNNSNSEIETARNVLKIITELPDEVKKTLNTIASKSEETKKYAVIFNDHLKKLVFSDTIVFTLEYEKNDDENTKRIARKCMLLAGASLAKKMFYSGLPLRGVIHEGEFIVEKNCFAGKAVVESYRLCEELDFSGLVCTDDLKKNIDASYEPIPKFLFEYLTPFKNEKEKKLLNINWIYFIADTDEFKNGFRNDVDNRVLRSFWAHGKDCPISVDGKIRNTTKSLRKMIQIVESARAAKL